MAKTKEENRIEREKKRSSSKSEANSSDDNSDAKSGNKESRKNDESKKHFKHKTQTIDKHWLRAHPLPRPSDDGDKEERGTVLIVGGAPQMPGAVILAATAALRAGAGKLQIATCEGIAAVVGAQVPESYVVGLPTNAKGALTISAAEKIVEYANKAKCVLIGPGMVEEDAVTSLLLKLLPQLETTSIVLDAAALACFTEHADIARKLSTQTVVVTTPHAGEMASMLGRDKDELLEKPEATAREAAAKFGTVTALKGAETFIAAPEGETLRNITGNVGLATSGSGDTLSGIIAGLLARGTAPLDAVAWGVYLHGRAGEVLTARCGRIGFLARELLAEIPPLMHDHEARK